MLAHRKRRSWRRPEVHMAETMAKTRNTVAKTVTIAGGRGGALVILFALVSAFSIATPDFLTGANLVNILRQYAVLMILAVGQTLVIVSRGIDLSVAATAALSGCVMGVSFAHWGWPEPVALLFGLAAGFAVGAFNGFVITKWSVPDFIATLGTLVAVRGIALLVTGGLPVPDYERAVEGRNLPELVSTLGVDSILGIPLIACVALACVLIGGLILSRTKLGRSAYAIGGNTEAARMSGIKVGRSKMWIYIISGLFAAVVIGGTNLFGGEGKISGTVIGVLIIGVLSNGLLILGVAEFWQRVVNGLIIVVVVALDQWRRRAAQAASA